MNRLFVAKKPLFISSNNYLSKLKRKYGVSKAGFSGTLDPFAKGCLFVAFGEYTKLLPYLKLEPKEYIATLWLGANSRTLDLEGLEEVLQATSFEEGHIKELFNSLEGDIVYKPPIFSAKSIDGKRAYKEAREGRSVELKEITSKIFKLELICYNHPFLTFRAIVSKGSYIRSIGEIVAKKLGAKGCLSFLERVREGEFCFENEVALDPLSCVDLPKNRYNNAFENLLQGKKLSVSDFLLQDSGKYVVSDDKYLSIVEICGGSVKYLVNRIELC